MPSYGAATCFQHRAWMLRSYVVTFGFVTLRVVEASLMTLGVSRGHERRHCRMAVLDCTLLIADPLFVRHDGSLCQ